MGKPVTVLHWLLLTLGLVAAQGKAFTYFLGGKSRVLEKSITKHIKVRSSAHFQKFEVF